MIRSLFAVVCLTLLSFSGKACDGCGAAIAGGGVGLLTQANARYFGLSYGYSLFHIGQHSSSTLNKDEFTDLQLLTRIGLSKRLMIQGTLPYRFIQRSGPETLPVEESGLGDATILLQYNCLDQLTKQDHRLFWSMAAGASIPSGKYNGVYDDKTPDYLNPGTGAWGWIIQSNFSFHAEKWGLNSRSTAHFKHQNSADYRFGNQYTHSLLAFWRMQASKVSLAPFAGMYGELLQNGRRHGLAESPSTAGWGTFGQLGFETNFNQWNLSAQWMIPVKGHYSEGEASAKSRIALTLAILI